MGFGTRRVRVAGVSVGQEELPGAVPGKWSETAHGNRNRGGTSQEGQVKLTSRQQEILRQLAAGRIAKEIAANLDLSQKTVEYHKYRMMQALDIRSGAKLIQYAIRHGFASE